MASEATGLIDRKRMIENIVFLWSLTKFPESPTDNELRTLTNDKRQLSIEREQQLAKDFAFIAAATDDTTRIVAACIEEHPDQMGMTVCVAANTGDLSDLQEQLNGISKIIERAALRVDSRDDIRRDLLEQIIILDEPRILSRLRSSRAARTRKTEGKQKLTDLFKGAANDPSIKTNTHEMKAKLGKLRSQSERLSQLLEDFEVVRDSGGFAESPLNILLDLMTQFHEIDTKDFELVFRRSRIDPSTTKKLAQACNKIGHYYVVADDLVNAARRSQYTLFGCVTIHVLKAPNSSDLAFSEDTAAFEDVIQRITGVASYHRRYNSSSCSISAVRASYNSRMFPYNIPWKVHAEIQLLLYYEQHPVSLSPRIFCSSKKACYLCDLFLKLHGRFQTPNTHGRIYEAWTIPKLTNPSIINLVQRFNARLEAKILQIIGENSRGGRRFRNVPNESVLHLRQPWPSTSTLVQASVRSGSVRNPTPTIEDRLETPRTLVLGHGIEGPGPEVTCETNLGQREEPSKVQDPSINSLAIDDSDIKINSLGSSLVSQKLEAGNILYREFTGSSNAVVIQTGALKVHAYWDAECARSNDDSSAAKKSCWLQFQAYDGDSQTSRPDAAVVDLDTLDETEDKIIEAGAVLSSKALCLKKGRREMLLLYFPEDPRNKGRNSLNSSGQF